MFLPTNPQTPLTATSAARSATPHESPLFPSAFCSPPAFVPRRAHAAPGDAAGAQDQPPRMLCHSPSSLSFAPNPASCLLSAHFTWMHSSSVCVCGGRAHSIAAAANLFSYLGKNRFSSLLLLCVSALITFLFICSVFFRSSLC